MPGCRMLAVPVSTFSRQFFAKRTCMTNRNKTGKLPGFRSICVLCLFASFISLLFGCAGNKKLAGGSNSVEVDKIWDRAPHNAFTDLIRFDNAFYCAFREAPAHVSGPSGSVRIIKSADGYHWKSIADFHIASKDIRDPKLTVTPNHQLMVLMDVESYKQGKLVKRQPYISYSDQSGARFSKPSRSYLDPAISSWSNWVWRLTWHKGTGYAVVYQPDGIFLLQTQSGNQFKKVSRINIDGSPNESTIRFDEEGKMYVLIRRESGDKRGVLATSRAPYREWNFHKLDVRLGGPDFTFLSDSVICIGSRKYPEAGATNYSTALFLADRNGQIFKTLPLPSKGDTGYPGIVRYDGKLWVSYYSSDAGRTSIYLAKIPLDKLAVEL